MSERCRECGSPLPEYGSIVCDDERGEIRLNGRFVRNLTIHEFDIFRILLNRQGRPVNKESLLSTLYTHKILSDDEVPEIKIIDVFICKLRKKLQPLGLKIGTVWGRGYYLVEPT